MGLIDVKGSEAQPIRGQQEMGRQRMKNVVALDVSPKRSGSSTIALR